jgi:hypothetical protein
VANTHNIDATALITSGDTKDTDIVGPSSPHPATRLSHLSIPKNNSTSPFVLPKPQLLAPTILRSVSMTLGTTENSVKIIFALL